LVSWRTKSCDIVQDWRPLIRGSICQHRPNSISAQLIENVLLSDIRYSAELRQARSLGVYLHVAMARRFAALS